jgi:secreted trypsin-like serine protease
VIKLALIVLFLVGERILSVSGYQILTQHSLEIFWKRLFIADGKYQNILKLIELPVVPKLECENQLRQSRLGPFFNLHPSFICAGGNGNDACNVSCISIYYSIKNCLFSIVSLSHQGDGGSPLACPREYGDPRYHELTGLVSWGIGCAEKWPGVYVNVARYVDWLKDWISKYDSNYTSYFAPSN